MLDAKMGEVWCCPSVITSPRIHQDPRHRDLQGWIITRRVRARAYRDRFSLRKRGEHFEFVLKLGLRRADSGVLVSVSHKRAPVMSGMLMMGRCLSGLLCLMPGFERWTALASFGTTRGRVARGHVDNSARLLCPPERVHLFCNTSTTLSRNEEETVKRQVQMTEGTEETITDPQEVLAKRTRRGVPRKPRVPRKRPPPACIQLSPALQSELRKLQHAAARESSGSASGRAADKALALLLPDTGPRSLEISTVYTYQDTESECETETGQCTVDNDHKCDRVVETEKWLTEDFHRQRCEVRARRDAKMCCRILTALGRKEWNTWNDVPMELRKDIKRIHRNLGHASADQ